MAKKATEEQEEEVAEFEEFVDEEVTEFKVVDAAQDKKMNLERRRKIEEKIELFRLRDECGDYDLEI